MPKMASTMIKRCLMTQGALASYNSQGSDLNVDCQRKVQPTETRSW